MSDGKRTLSAVTFREAIEALKNVNINEIEHLISRIDVPVLKPEDVFHIRISGFNFER